jgi:hypothetical protein
MSPSLGRRKLFRNSLTDVLRAYIANAAWPLAGKGEVDDAARGHAYFRSYKTRIDQSTTDTPIDFDGAGRRLPGLVFRPIGTMPLPLITGQQVIRGTQIAAANPLRTRLLLRMTGPNNTVIFLSNNEAVSTFDYRIDIGENEDAWYYSTSDIFAAATKAGTILFLAEEVSA